jgi:outer membrane pore protein E
LHNISSTSVCVLPWVTSSLKGKDIEGIGDEDLVKYIDVGATYYFSKNMSAFVDYKINQIDDDNKLGVSSDDIVALGMTYRSKIIRIRKSRQISRDFLPGGATV